MKLTLNIENTENMRLSPERQQNYEEILTALVSSGGLDGVKGGKTIIHFDPDGVFMAVQLDYYPWRRRKKGV